MDKILTEETKQVIANVDGRFFLVRQDGSIDNVNAFNKAHRWSFLQLASARACANRQKANIFDKRLGRFID